MEITSLTQYFNDLPSLYDAAQYLYDFLREFGKETLLVGGLAGAAALYKWGGKWAEDIAAIGGRKVGKKGLVCETTYPQHEDGSYTQSFNTVGVKNPNTDRHGNIDPNYAYFEAIFDAGYRSEIIGMIMEVASKNLHKKYDNDDVFDLLQYTRFGKKTIAKDKRNGTDVWGEICDQITKDTRNFFSTQIDPSKLESRDIALDESSYDPQTGKRVVISYTAPRLILERGAKITEFKWHLNKPSLRPEHVKDKDNVKVVIEGKREYKPEHHYYERLGAVAAMAQALQDGEENPDKGLRPQAFTIRLTEVNVGAPAPAA